MGIDMVDLVVRKHPPDHWIGLARLDQRGIDHHPVGTERSKRKDSAVQSRWDLILEYRRLAPIFADKDRMAGPVGVIALVRDMVDQQQRLPLSGIV